MSAKHFIKDLEDYLIDTELTDTDRKRIEIIFERHSKEPQIVVKEIIKEVPKIRIVRDAVFIDREKMVYIDKETGQLVRPTRKNIRKLNTEDECKKVLYEACNTWRVSYEELTSPKRERRMVWARFFCYKILQGMGYSLNEIGKIFNRDHTTVINGIREAGNMIAHRVQPFYMFWNNRMIELEDAENKNESCEKCGKLL